MYANSAFDRLENKTHSDLTKAPWWMIPHAPTAGHSPRQWAGRKLPFNCVNTVSFWESTIEGRSHLYPYLNWNSWLEDLKGYRYCSVVERWPCMHTTHSLIPGDTKKKNRNKFWEVERALKQYTNDLRKRLLGSLFEIENIMEGILKTK